MRNLYDIFSNNNLILMEKLADKKAEEEYTCEFCDNQIKEENKDILELE